MARRTKHKSTKRLLPLDTVYTIDNIIYIMPGAGIDDEPMIWYKYTPSTDLRHSVSIWVNSLRHNISLKEYLNLLGMTSS